MKLDLYIDFDGVILNTIDITYKKINDLKRNISDEIDMNDYYKNLDWFHLLEESSPISNSINNIKKIMDSNLYNVAVLSNVSSDSEALAKTEYLQMRLPGLRVITVEVGMNKCDVVDCKNAILVDDYMGNLELWNDKGGISIKFSDKGKKNKFISVSSLDMLLSKYDEIKEMIDIREGII
jgi:hypothetical protein